MDVLILHGSQRKNGNTAALANEFMCGAKDAGHKVTKVELKEKQIVDCLGCGACQINIGQCIQRDDMITIYEQLKTADVILFASPVYFYTWTSLMKRLIDRTFAIEKLLSNKTFYLISAGAAPNETYMKTMIDSFNQYIECFRSGNNKNGGYIFAYNTDIKDNSENRETLKKAYELGRNIL